MILSNATSDQYFGWDLFEGYNRIAKELLEPYGVHYLDTMSAIGPRKQHDINIAGEERHLHWCNPGPATIPKFIGNMFMHLLAIDKFDKVMNDDGV